ncbi:hypothetical protein BGZ59_005040 [Podila verticillata]|nr:hypothetical protein BGZ59_005040 [Podila verticillata]
MPQPASNRRSNKLGSLLAVAGLAGLAFLGSSLAPAVDATLTFGAAHDTPGFIVLGALKSMVPKPPSLVDKYLVPGLVNFTSAGVTVNSSTRVIVKASGSLKNPFGPVTLPLGQVGVGIYLDGISLANITTSDLTIPAGIAPVNVTATIDVAEGAKNPALQTSINNLATGLFGGSTPSGEPPKLMIKDITVSGVSMGLDPFTVPTQPTPAGPIQKPADGTAPQTGVPPVIGLAGIMDPNATLTWPVLNKVVVKAVSGSQLTAGVGFSWYNPLNIDIDIPYISVDIGFNGTRVVTVGVQAIHLAQGNMTADTLVDLKFNNDPAAAVQLGAFVNDFLAGTLNQVVNIGNIQFGTPGDNSSATGALLNSLFSGLNIDLPLMGVSTEALKQLALSFIQPYLPIDISKLGSGVGPSLLTYVKSLAVSTAPGHTLLISPSIQVPFPFLLDLNIPYFSLDINLDNNLLGQLFLVNFVGTGQGQVDISVGVGIVFKEPSPLIPASVAKLVNGLTTGSSLDILAGVSNIALGLSPTDAITTLTAINVAVPISSVITGHISTGDLINSIVSQTNITLSPSAVGIKIGTLAELTIHEANIAVLPNNLVTAEVNLDVFLGLPVVANIGYFGVQISLDGAQLAAVDLTSGLDYAGGKVQMNAAVGLTIGTGAAISGNVANLVNVVIAKQPVTSVVGISGITIGQGQNDTINALSQLSFSLPLGGLIGGAALPSLPTGFLNSTIAQLGLSVTDLSLDTIPGAGLQIGAKASFANPIPVTVTVPFIGISGGLDKIDIVDVGLNNIALLPGPNALQAGISLNFNNAVNAQAKVATFVGEILGGQLGATPEALTVHNLRIGASPTDYFDLLSQIDIAIPSKDLLNQANVDLIIGKLGLNSTELLSNVFSNLKIGGISADLTKAPVIDLGASVSVSNFSLNAAVNIGYVGIDIALDTHALAHIDVPSIVISTANNQLTLAIKASITVQDTPEVQTDIANLVNYFLTNGTTSPVNNVVISKPLLGASITDNIQTFSQIQYPLALPPLLLKAKSLVNQLLASAGGLNLNSLAISGLVVDLNSPSVINLQGGLLVKNLTLPADISISYVGVSLGLDATPLAGLTIPSLNLSSANNALSINFQALVDVQQSPDLNGQIAKLVGAVLQPGQVAPPTNLVISQLVFGGDPAHLFHILSQIKINVAIAPYLQQITQLLNGAVAGGAATNLLGGLDIGSLVVDLNSPQTIGIDAAISLKNITIPAEIKLNYVGVNVAINTVALAQIAVPSFSLKPVAGALAITAHIDVALLTSPALTQAITSLVTGVINNQTTPATNVVLSGAVFGGSPTDVFTILQGIAIPVNVAPYINKLPALLAGSGSLLDRVAVSNLVVDLNSPQTIGIDAGVLVKNLALPATIKLNYVGVNIALNTVPLAQVAIPTFTLAPQGADLALQVHVNVALLSSPEAAKAISGLIGAVLGNQTLPTTNVVLSGAVFGASATNVFTFLQGVAIPVNITPYIAKIGGLLGGSSSLLNGLGLSGLAINLNQAPVIGIDANIAVRNISIPAKLNVGYLGLGVGINGVSIVDVAIPKLVLGSSGADLTIGTHVDATLKDTDAAQTVVAGLVSSVVAGQAPQGTIVVSNIAFGASATNVFTFLQDVQISIPIAKILSLVPATPGTNATSILNQLSLQSADINMKSPPRIGADVAIALAGYSFDAQLLLNYVGVTAFLDTTQLATVDVPTIKLASGSNQITLSASALVQLASGSAIQAKVAAIAAQVLGSGPAQNVNLVVSNVLFGGSATNSFHILDKVKVSVPLAPYIQKLTGIVGGIIGGGNTTVVGAPAVTVKNLAISATGPNDLSVAVSAAIGGLGSKISVAMPYVGLQVNANGAGLVYPAINNLQLVNGNLDLTLALPFQSGAQSFVAALSTPVSQLMFTTVGTVSGSVVATGIQFGASPSQAFDLASTIQLSLSLNTIFQKAQAYINAHNPLHVNDMNTVLTTTGIQATITVPGIPLGSLPLKMNFPISLSGYHKGVPILNIQADALGPRDGILPNVLEWKNALQDVTLGGVTLGSFTALQGLTITPPVVTLWSPITVPLDQLKVHLVPLGMDFTAAFVNKGPMQVDVGTVSIMIMQGNNDVIQISNLGGPIHLNNGLQAGGANSLALNASLKFNFLELFSILAALLNPAANFKFVFSMRTSSGAAMPWLQDALNGAPAAIFNNLLPILAKALGNVKFTL